MRLSRGTLQKATADLQDEIERRIYEGFWARMKRYFFTDPELRRRIALARGAKATIKGMEGKGE